MAAIYVGNLLNPAQAVQVFTRAAEKAREYLQGGQTLSIKIAKPSRSLDQNAKFHAMCSDLERAGTLWAGKPRNAEAWKVLLVSGHAVATNQESNLTLGIENEVVNLRESTASMTVARSSSLIEYTQAFMAMQGVDSE
jgi:NinB protein